MEVSDGHLMSAEVCIVAALQVAAVLTRHFGAVVVTRGQMSPGCGIFMVLSAAVDC
jgi:hypothetical protein